MRRFIAFVKGASLMLAIAGIAMLSYTLDENTRIKGYLQVAAENGVLPDQRISMVEAVDIIMDTNDLLYPGVSDRGRIPSFEGNIIPPRYEFPAQGKLGWIIVGTYTAPSTCDPIMDISSVMTASLKMQFKDSGDWEVIDIAPIVQTTEKEWVGILQLGEVALSVKFNYTNSCNHPQVLFNLFRN